MATVHAKYSVKPFKALAKTTLLQSILSAATMACTLKYTQDTWNFLLVEMEYQPLQSLNLVRVWRDGTKKEMVYGSSVNLLWNVVKGIQK